MALSLTAAAAEDKTVIRYSKSQGPYTELFEDGIIPILEKQGYTYEKDGALWFKLTELGAEKDEVLRRSNGFYTYFAVDMAYHRNKFIERGFEQRARL